MIHDNGNRLPSIKYFDCWQSCSVCHLFENGIQNLIENWKLKCDRIYLNFQFIQNSINKCISLGISVSIRATFRLLGLTSFREYFIWFRCCFRVCWISQHNSQRSANYIDCLIKIDLMLSHLKHEFSCFDPFFSWYLNLFDISHEHKS